jgi:hypothetical protein
MAVDRPYGKFYDFYSVIPENIGSTLVYPGNPQPLTQLSTTYPTTPLNTKSQLTDTISTECNHYH